MVTDSKASISTPVLEELLHFETTSNPSNLFTISISTEFKGIWWQSGIISEVFLAANIPAVFATEITSPLIILSLYIFSLVAVFKLIKASAIAVLLVTSF